LSVRQLGVLPREAIIGLLVEKPRAVGKFVDLEYA
jgi:hypothetical protein